jgi:hypothetical protein
MMCCINTIPSEDIIFESQKIEWIQVMRINKIRSQYQESDNMNLNIRDKSPQPNFLFHAILKPYGQKAKIIKCPDLKALNRKERLCQSGKKFQYAERETPLSELSDSKFG